jgi:hypothetical protein
MDANSEELFAGEQPKPESMTISLQKLWRKISFLFWQHPLLLWSPLLIADIARYWVVTVGLYISRAVIYKLLPHSVLSRQPDPLPLDSRLSVIALTAGVITWISYVFSFFLYSIAFIFIANRVYKLTVEPAQISKLQGVRIIAVALKLTFLLTCLSLTVAFMSDWIITIFPLSHVHRSQLIPILLSVLACAAAIFAARPFLRLASSARNMTRGFTSGTTVQAWLLLSGTLLVSILLEFTVMHANISYPNHPSTVFNRLFGLIGSLISEMPYIPMMIGIALLAEDEKPESHSAISKSEPAPSTDLNLS